MKKLLMKNLFQRALALTLMGSVILTLPADIRAADKDNSLPWYITNTGAPDLWDKLEPTQLKKDVVVAVIDTGIDYNHPDLQNALWINEKEAKGIEGVDDDGNGYIDDIYGINCLNSSVRDVTGDPLYDTEATDSFYYSHGTHVAGIVAQVANITAKSNPYRVKIMSIRAGSGRGNFDYDDIIVALDYATSMGADIINLSLGTATPSEKLTKAIEKASKSSVIVAAAGNAEGRRASSTQEEGSIVGKNIYPAAYPYVVGVMYHEENMHLSDNSNWDAIADTDYEYEYEISAPGQEIRSTIPEGEYSTQSGTSMAAPFVSSSLALILQGQRQSGSKKTAPKYLKSLLYSSSVPDVSKIYGVLDPLTFRRLSLTDYAKTLTRPKAKAPAKPKLKVSRSGSYVKLSWKKDSLVTSYKIYRRKGKSGKYQLYKALTSDKTSFIDKKITKNTTYYYKLKAIGSNTSKVSDVQNINITSPQK